jgi:spore germination protein GerM
VLPLLRSFFNLILALLIGFSCSSLPIEISRLFYIPVEQAISYSFQPAHTEVTNPQIVSFSVKTKQTNISIRNNPGKNLKVEAYKNGTPVESLVYLELETGRPGEDIVITRDNPLLLQVDISQKITGLPDGEYFFRFYLQDDKLAEIEPLELKVNYISDPKYYKSLNYEPKDNMGLVLYFPSPDNKYLVPVTRFVPDSKSVLTTTIQNLALGADPETALQQRSIIPGVVKVYYSGSTVYVMLDPDSERLKDTGNLHMALDSIVYTMTEIPQMRRVQFLLDGKRVDEIAQGIAARNPWLPDKSPAAYLAYNTFDRYLLFPYRPDMSEAETIRDKCFALFETLKLGIPGDPLVEAVVPKEVELLNVYFLKDTLTLDFNDAFLEAYSGERHKQYMMMDSILYTFSSVETVKNIQVLVEGSDQYSFADYSLSKPLTRPLYINPEKN